MVPRWSARSVHARPDTDGLSRSDCAGAIAAWRFIGPPEELPLTIEFTPRHKGPPAFPAGASQPSWFEPGRARGLRTSAPGGAYAGGSAVQSIQDVRWVFAVRPAWRLQSG